MIAISVRTHAYVYSMPTLAEGDLVNKSRFVAMQQDLIVRAIVTVSNQRPIWTAGHCTDMKDACHVIVCVCARARVFSPFLISNRSGLAWKHVDKKSKRKECRTG